MFGGAYGKEEGNCNAEVIRLGSRDLSVSSKYQAKILYTLILALSFFGSICYYYDASFILASTRIQLLNY